MEEEIERAKEGPRLWREEYVSIGVYIERKIVEILDTCASAAATTRNRVLREIILLGLKEYVRLYFRQKCGKPAGKLQKTG